MNTDGRVELGLVRAAVHCHGQSLDDLTCVGSDHVASYDFVRCLIGDDLHHDILISASQSVLQRSKAGPVNVDGFISFARLCLSQPNGSNVRRAEDDRRNIDVARFRRIVIEKGLAHGAPFGDGNGS